MSRQTFSRRRELQHKGALPGIGRGGLHRVRHKAGMSAGQSPRLPFGLLAEIRIHGDLELVVRVFALHLFADLPIHLPAVFGVEADDDVEADRLLRPVQIEAVHLQDVGMGRHNLRDLFPGGRRLRVLRVDGIYADGGEDHVVLPEHLHHDLAQELVQVVGGESVGHLDVDRAAVCVRAVIVQDQVIGAADLRVVGDRRLDVPGKLRVRPLAEDLRQRVPKHFKAGFDDHGGDDRAQPRLQRDVEEQVDPGGHQGGGGDDTVHRGVCAGIDEGIGVDLFPDALDVPTQDDLHHHRDGHDDQGRRVVIRRVRMDDLFHGFHEGGDPRVQHQQRNDHGAQVFDPAVAEGVLPVRLLPGQLRPDDGDDRTGRVRQVVDRVHHDGDGIGRQADGRLEGRQKDVGRDPDDAGADDDLVPTCLPVHACDAPFRNIRIGRSAPSPQLTASFLQFFGDGGADLRHVHGGLEAGDDPALAADEELREVPADVGRQGDVAALPVLDGEIIYGFHSDGSFLSCGSFF